MGCCFSEPDADDAPANNHSQMPLDHHSSQASCSPQKLNQPDNAEALRLQGNEHFKRKQFAQAIEAYKRAIALPNPNAAYFSNLALAYKANGQYEQSIATVEEMIRRPTFRTYQHAEYFRKAQIVKARCIIIQSRDYCLSGDYSEPKTQQKIHQIRSAVSLLEEITAVPNTNKEVQAYLQSGTKILRFMQEEVLPRSKHQGLLQYLRERLAGKRLQGAMLHFYTSQQELVAQISLLVQEQMKLALEQPQQFIVDPITYDIFDVPVIVPSGQSYDKAILLQHFKNNGYNDPITHELYKLGQKVIVRNLNLEAYISQVRRNVTKNDLDYLKY